MYRLLPCLATFLTLAASALAQSSAGTITGRVLDPSGTPVAAATVVLTNANTAEIRTFTSDNLGEFVFTSIQPGVYELSIKSSGFKQLEKKGLALSASEKLSAGDLKLQLGSVSESVEVRADTAPVQIVSSEKSAELDSVQVTNMPSRGRDVMALLTILPGVVNDGEGNDSFGVWNSPAAISGTRGVYGAMNMDGISGNTRSGDHLDTPSNMDTVAEVKVLTNTYQAEYGKGAGGIINIVTKSGTKEFHGSAYYFNRNDFFNANNFFSNRQGNKRGRYRYNTVGGTFGGPVYIPKLLTRRQKLFFFGAYENLPNQQPNGPRNYTVPTALERIGDFSQTFDKNGKLITITDPFTKAQFPGNKIPANRIDPNMQKLLNVFPLPNYLNGRTASGTGFNYQIQDFLQRPAHNEFLRVDYYPSDNVKTFIRGSNGRTHNEGPASTVNRYPWMPDANVDYTLGFPTLGGTVTWIASPTVVNELSVGWAGWTENQYYPSAWLSKLQRDKIGMTLGQHYPKANPLNLIPSTNFSGIDNVARTQWEGRFPMEDIADTWSLSDSITKVKGAHTLKAGIQWEHVHYLFQQSGTSDNFPGSFSFSSDSLHPMNTGYAYSNALIGAFTTYTESTNRSQYSPVTPILEFYTQDSWKVTSRLTLDLGVRFTAGLAQYMANDYCSTFLPGRYNPAKAPLLYQPALNASKTRIAVNPLTGEQLPAAYIGQQVPGTGDLMNGIVKCGSPDYPRGLVDYKGILPAPRIGFAWDVFGDQKTAIRGGFGTNYNPRNGSGIMGDLSTNPPIVYNPVQRYGTTADFLNTGGTISPSGFSHVLDRNNRPPRVYNASLGIQRNVGFGTVVDVSYVGSFGRHIGQTIDINMLPYGTRFLPSSLDATNSNKPFTDDYLRPYQGYGSIKWLQFDGNSSYHSLQAQARRRFSHGLQFGVSYTFSKAMAYSDGDQGTVSTYVARREFDYGLASYDRTHVLALNYLWNLPRLSRVVNNAFVKQVFDGWQISGVTRFQSGSPLSIGTLGTGNLDSSIDLTGGGDGWRPVMSGNPVLPKDQRTVERYFNIDVFSPPGVGGKAPTDIAGVNRILALGNTPGTFGRGPGLNNWNLSLFKNIRVRERLNMQFRAEAYNAFNHTQFSTVNVSPKWNYTTGAQTGAQFGQITAARDPRIMQFALRLQF
ncbi:MAG TPA: carboxypeptidase regulatory-like domain-containing protein [Candidatus Solibacter sp.]|nr:carboxypeptidase regulatory-like domain-containing protein [Candidatus Solibacter sp.]